MVVHGIIVMLGIFMIINYVKAKPEKYIYASFVLGYGVGIITSNLDRRSYFKKQP